MGDKDNFIYNISYPYHPSPLLLLILITVVTYHTVLTITIPCASWIVINSNWGTYMGVNAKTTVDIRLHKIMSKIKGPTLTPP